jgi:hypothetical protein
VFPVVLAHQGGWDELLLFLGAVGLGWWGLRAAERRARAQEAAVKEAMRDDPPGNADEAGGTPGPTGGGRPAAP